MSIVRIYYSSTNNSLCSVCFIVSELPTGNADLDSHSYTSVEIFACSV